MRMPPILALLLLLLAGVAAARPCKTIFYFSATTTTSYRPYDSLSGNLNPNPSRNPHYLTLIFTTTATPSIRFPVDMPTFDFKSDRSVDDDDSVPSSLMTSSDLPLKFYSSVSNSIRDRTRDIMSVVGALLFGVACGALTAATMYFLWALFSPRRFDLDDASSSDDDDDDDEKVAIAKKFGYLAIPANPKVVDDDIKKPAPTTTEVV